VDHDISISLGLLFLSLFSLFVSLLLIPWHGPLLSVLP
jgi:hypothetical protein